MKHYEVTASWKSRAGEISHNFTTTRKRDAIAYASDLFNEVQGFRVVGRSLPRKVDNPGAYQNVRWIQYPRVDQVIDGKTEWSRTIPSNRTPSYL